MSRLRAVTVEYNGGFPRVSGDEPHLRAAPLSNVLFSPRERG